MLPDSGKRMSAFPSSNANLAALEVENATVAPFSSPRSNRAQMASVGTASHENKGLAFAAVTSRTTFAAPMTGIANHDWIALA
jgi:hypothetical protein